MGGSVIDESLAHLPPSRELVQHFRNKVLEYEAENLQLSQQLQEFIRQSDRQNQLESEVQLREDEVRTLQRALSDLQVCLLQEREHVVRLNAENDRLKIQELADRRKIQQLLSMVQGQRTAGRYLVDVGGGTTRISTGDTPPSQDDSPPEDSQTLKLQITALQAQLAEHTETSRHEINALAAERLVTLQESELQRRRDADKIKFLASKLAEVEANLQHTIKQELEMIRRLRRCESHLAVHQAGATPQTAVVQTTSQQDVGLEVRMACRSIGVQASGGGSSAAGQNEELRQSRKMAQIYQSQNVRLGTLVSRLKEEHAASLQEHQDKMAKLRQELQLLKSRQLREEQHQRSKLEGYRTDIRALRSQIQNLEKYLLKAVHQLKCEEHNLDLVYLAQETTAKARTTLDQILGLKSQIAQLEKDILRQ